MKNNPQSRRRTAWWRYLKPGRSRFVSAPIALIRAVIISNLVLLLAVVLLIAVVVLRQPASDRPAEAQSGVAACLQSGWSPPPRGMTQALSWNGLPYRIHAVDLQRTHLALHFEDQKGERIGSFARLDRFLLQQGRRPLFMTNGGIFSKDYKPLGLFISAGVERSPLNLAAGEGNFFLRPNGVVAFGAKEAWLGEASRFAENSHGGRFQYAIQSGPMLVIDGKIHPAFSQSSTGRYIRSGVCARSQGVLLFGISEEKVSFYEFASFFRDALGCRDALYLDGAISAFGAEGRTWPPGRSDAEYATIFATDEPLAPGEDAPAPAGPLNVAPPTGAVAPVDAGARIDARGGGP
jgi:uncharacterized protein YigE (DUF2233 family)